MQRFLMVTLAFATLASFAMPQAADAKTFATSFVSARLARGTIGHDAGVDVSSGRYIRMTAGGGISLGYSACAHSVGPRGCAAAVSFGRVAPAAATGALLVAFVDRSGAPVTAWAAVGDAAYVAIPARASRMIMRVNGAKASDTGGFHVSVDVVTSSAASSGDASGAPVHRLSVGRTVANTGAFTRAEAQNLLRRFGFGGSSTDVTALLASGPTAWLTTQLSPATIDDSALANYMEAMPVYTGNTTIDQNINQRIELRIFERQIASQRQLLEKVTLHWLEHFSVSQNSVNDIGAMAHYEDTVRADALGNFAALVSDVAKEPAMLYWLDNNYNNGAYPASNPPNENFGRELMQLYTLGPNQLNQDGSNIVDANNVPLPNYGEPDVKAMALALTGFEVQTPYPEPTGVDPRTIDTVNFVPAAHAAGGQFTIMGNKVIDPGDATIVNAVMTMLAKQPSTAPFQVKEMLQRFVTDNPSPGYISRMAAVWTANVNDPNQIGKVVAAIAADPEFSSGARTLMKEPVEYTADAVRELGGAEETPLTYSATPFSNFQYDGSQMGQEIYYPPTVFSFYIPGDKESLLSNSALLQRWSAALDLTYHTSVQSCAASTTYQCSYYIDFTKLKGVPPAQIAGYLCDTLVDGGTPELRQLVTTYLSSNQSGGVAGALWIVLTSPEYEVN